MPRICRRSNSNSPSIHPDAFCKRAFRRLPGKVGGGSQRVVRCCTSRCNERNYLPITLSSSGNRSWVACLPFRVGRSYRPHQVFPRKCLDRYSQRLPRGLSRPARPSRVNRRSLLSWLLVWHFSQTALPHRTHSYIRTFRRTFRRRSWLPLHRRREPRAAAKEQPSAQRRKAGA